MTFFAALSIAVGLGQADGIPEPSLVMYGVVRNVSGGGNTRLTSGTLTWVFRSAASGQTVTVATPLTNINDQFSYVLRVPCEAVPAGFTPSANTLRLATPPLSCDRSQVLVDGAVQATFVQPAQATLALSSQDRGRIERVDLTVAIVAVDSDGDGLPDAWEQQYLGSLAFGPNEDPDQDGLSNLAEYKAGTNPGDPSSCFAFIDIQSDAQGGIRVEWSSVEGKAYTLQRSSDVTSGFTTIEAHIAATAPLNRYRDGTAVGAGPYFYRLQVE
jgi:hypothetical protein